MIALTEQQIEKIELGLHKSIEEIDTEICDAEQSVFAILNKTKKKGADSSELLEMEERLNQYGESVRALRASLAKLEKQTHALVSPNDNAATVNEAVRKEIATQIQKETHNKPATFKDFVKGLLMWRDAPEDRMRKD